MLKKTITFEDLDGNPITEDFYFHLSKAEIAEMALSQDQEGDLAEKVKLMIKNNDAKNIIATFKEILSIAYGVRGADNKSFEKSPEIWLKFLQTGAYSELFMELVTDAEASAAFIRGIMPADLVDKIDNPQLPIQDVQLPPESSAATFPPGPPPTRTALGLDVPDEELH